MAISENEHAWLTQTDPRVLLELVAEVADERCLRLTACAGARFFWRQMGPLGKRAVEAAERFAADPATRPALLAARQTIKSATVAFVDEREVRSHWSSSDASAHNCVADDAAGAAEHVIARLARRPERRAHGCLVLRDLFGNPFRRLNFDPSWRTAQEDAVGGLAREIDERLDFTLMPALADALEAVGCKEQELLDHCRLPRPTEQHFRGCWALELCLGRTPLHIPVATTEEPTEPNQETDEELEQLREQVKAMECGQCQVSGALNACRVNSPGTNHRRLYLRCAECDWFLWWGEPVRRAEAPVLTTLAPKATPCPDCGQPRRLHLIRREGPTKGRLFLRCTDRSCGSFEWVAAPESERPRPTVRVLRGKGRPDARLERARRDAGVCERCGAEVAIHRVKRPGPNKGKLFRKCDQCGWFAWATPS